MFAAWFYASWSPRAALGRPVLSSSAVPGRPGSAWVAPVLSLSAALSRPGSLRFLEPSVENRPFLRGYCGCERLRGGVSGCRGCLLCFTDVATCGNYRGEAVGEDRRTFPAPPESFATVRFSPRGSFFDGGLWISATGCLLMPANISVWGPCYCDGNINRSPRSPRTAWPVATRRGSPRGRRHRDVAAGDTVVRKGISCTSRRAS